MHETLILIIFLFFTLVNRFLFAFLNFYVLCKESPLFMGVCSSFIRKLVFFVYLQLCLFGALILSLHDKITSGFFLILNTKRRKEILSAFYDVSIYFSKQLFLAFFGGFVRHSRSVLHHQNTVRQAECLVFIRG